MAYSIVKIGKSYNSSQYTEFILDSNDDVSTLPDINECAAGSIANVVGGGKFILSPSGDWTYASNSSSGSSGGSSSGSTVTIVSGKPTTLYSSEITVSTYDTSGAPLFEIDYTLPTGKTYGALYAIIEDKNGKRNGYFYKSETVMVMTNGAVTTSARGVYATAISSNGSEVNNSYGGGSTAYGLFISSISRDTNKFKIYARYNSANSGIINGTYTVKVYAIADPR